MNPIWIRRLALTIGTLLLLLAVAAGVFVASFDANGYKALAVRWMQTEHQRTLVIDGPIELSVFPRLALKVTRLRLSERGRSDEFAAVDEASAALQLWPLLRRQIVLGGVSARGVRVNYLRNARGERNIDDLLTARAGPPEGSVPPAGGAAPVRIDISALAFDDLRLHLQDDMAPLVGDVVVHSLTAGRLADQTETPVSLRASVQLTRPRPARLAVQGRMTLRLDLERQGMGLSAVKLEVEAAGAGVEALALTLDGALGWDGAALRAGPLQVALKSASIGDAVLTPSTLALGQALFSPGSQRLELANLKLSLAGRHGAQAFEMALDWPHLVVDAHRLEGSALSGRVQLAGPNALAGTFSSALPSGQFDAVKVPGLALKVAGALGPRKVDATLRAGLTLDAVRGAAAVEQLDLRASVAEPASPPLSLSLQGSGQASTQAAGARLTGSINANRFELQATASFAAQRPRLKADARFDSLDLNTLFAPAPAAPSPAATAPADTPMPLDSLTGVDGQFKLEAGALAFRQYRVSEAQLAATLEAGDLSVTRLAGRAWGGRFEGSGSAEAPSRHIAIRLDARGVDVNALLKNVAGKDLLDGTGQVAVDIVSSGATVGALRSNLAGTAAVQLHDGAIKGFNLARALRQAKAALSLKQDAVARGSAVEKTDFSELHASARIAGGVAQSDDLDLKSPFLRLGGAGRFDIGRGRIDYTARATVTDSAAGQGGAGLEALRGITVPVQLSGPFEAIDWKIQWSAVVSAAVRNRVKDKLKEALGAQLGGAPGPADAASAPRKPEDRLKDRLRSLLK